jgi:hypothetical protein
MEEALAKLALAALLLLPVSLHGHHGNLERVDLPPAVCARSTPRVLHDGDGCR